MEKGRTEQIIEKLLDSVENGQSVPFGAGKVAVNKDETIMMLRELESIVNGELRVYREFNDRKGKIINDAKREAEEIIYEAEQTASRIRVTKRMSTIGTAFKAESLDKEEKQALRTAHDIYAASLIYTDEMLTEVNDVVAQAYDLVVNQYGRMIDTLQEKAELIAKNKAELMGSLKELSKEDRYTQILELGQLLSYELYSERMKARAMEEDGSYQMEMMFEEQVTATQQNTTQYNQSPQVAEVQPHVVNQVQQMPTTEQTTMQALGQDNTQVREMDSAFESVQQEALADSAFTNVQQGIVADSAFANVQQGAVTDSAFANMQQGAVADSAFVKSQQVAPQQTVNTQVTVEQQEIVQSQVVAQGQTMEPGQPMSKNIPEEEKSIEAVSKTLEMFKNYRPGNNNK